MFWAFQIKFSSTETFIGVNKFDSLSDGILCEFLKREKSSRFSKERLSL
jgi:hypothetical protein